MDYDPQMEARLKAVDDMKALLPHLATREEFAALKGELKVEMEGLRTEMATFRGEISVALANFETRIEKSMKDQTWKFVTYVAGLNGLIIFLVNKFGH